MRSKVTEQGVFIPKHMLQEVEEVDIRKEQDVILVVPVASTDPVIELGTDPITDEAQDASENHDQYRQVKVGCREVQRFWPFSWSTLRVVFGPKAPQFSLAWASPRVT